MKQKQTMWDKYKLWIKKTFPGKQKKAIEDWDFVMVFEERYREQMEAYFAKLHGEDSKDVRLKVISNEKDEELLVLIWLSENVVYDQAQELKILKRKQKKSFGFDLKTINREIYLAEQSKNIHMCNYLKWIRARLSPQNKKIYMQQQYSVFNKSKYIQYLPNQELYDTESKNLFTPEEELRTKYNYLLTYCIEQKGALGQQDTQIYPFYDIMRHAGFKELVPIHKDSKYGRVIVGNFKEYLGANSQTYFAFVAFMQKWLLFPTVIGIITFLYNISFEFTAEDSPADFLYAFFIMIWSIIFYTQWEHKQKWTAVCEQTGYSDQWSQFQNIVDRKGCKARESRLSGQRQQYIPFFQKLWRYFASMFVLSSVLFSTLYFMVLSLNARGFVDQDHKFLYFQSISAWAQTGGIFDADTSWAQIPNLVHVLVTNVFDEAIYRPLAKRFTKYQQHFSNKTYENNIIIKFFVYEYIITFADLFYIAFVRMDIIGLREQLLSLFFIDIVRRLIAELLIPKLISFKRSYSAKPGDPKDQEHQLVSQAILEINKDEYQPFDDYLQIITNFGYLVMLSACFPLAPLLILIAHSIELVQDKYKIIHIFKRKLPTKYVGMGYWNNIVSFLCYTAIITNILLFAFSSHQIVSFFPRLYDSGKDLLFGDTEITELVSNLASSMSESVTTSVTGAGSFIFDAMQNTATSAAAAAHEHPQSLYDPSCTDTPASNLLSQFKVPAEQNKIEFITILFFIQHVFLLLFMCLRSILRKQSSDADVLEERRHIKRGIKKYFKQNAILAGNMRNTVLEDIIAKNKQKEQVQFQNAFMPDLFANLFQKSLSKSDSSTSDPDKTKKE